MIRINLNITIVDMVAQKIAFKNSTVLVTAACFNEDSAVSVLDFSNKSILTAESSWRKFSLERKLLQSLNVSGISESNHLAI